MELAINKIASPVWTSLAQKDKAEKIIKKCTLYAAGIGFIPIPILDSISIMSLQLWVIKEIAKIYNIPFKKHFVKSLIGTLVGNIGSYSLLKVIPIFGISLGGAAFSISAASATYALGRVFLQHFDQGGTLLDFNPTTSRSFFLKIYNENKQTMERLSKTKEKSMISLRNINEQLMEEEKMHEELHLEADRFIIELKEVLKEQEAYYQKRLHQSDQTIQSLRGSIDILETQLREKEET